MKITTKINGFWNNLLKEEFKKDYFLEINNKISNDINNWIIIYPKLEDIFKAFEKTPFEKVKVVIIWQDPYHSEEQAQGFCFSVKKWTKLPPSLKNIYKELNNSLGIYNNDYWDLTYWAEQWVFLLNSILTVQAWIPASHKKIWWEKFTDNIIKTISDKKNWIIFLLWWTFAQSKKDLIDKSKHYILETSHPSPFSANKWFLWSNCFKKTNEILKQNWKKEINWKI